MPPHLATLVAAVSVIATVGIGLSLSLPLLSLEMERMGVSAIAIGLNSAIAGAAAIVISPFIPRWAARVGVGSLIGLALASCVIVLVMFKLTMNYWAWIPLRFLFSIGLSALFVLSEFWIASIAPPERRGLVMGIYASVLALGFAAGPLLLATVGTSGWAPYLSGAVLFLLASLPLVLASGSLPTLDAPPAHGFGGYVRAAPLAAAAGFVSGTLEIGAIALLPVQATRLGFDAGSAALLISVMAFGNVVSQPVLGWLADHMDRARLLGLIALGAMAASAMLSWTAVPGSWAIYAVIAVWGGLVGGFYTVGLAHLSARFTGADLAGANAAFVVMFNSGQMVGPITIGATLDASTRYGFSLGAIVFCATLLVARVAERRR